MTHFTFPYPPSANAYWRVWRGRPVKSDEARAYQRAVGLLCRVAGTRPLTGDVRVSLALYRPAKRGDLDNMLKVLLDALQGYAYLDDKQVRQIAAERLDDAARPRVEATIEPYEKGEST